MNSLTWILPIVAALIGALFGYLGVLRKTSGRISTSEAADLWEEARDLRGVYQEEISRLRREILRLEEKTGELDKLSHECKRELVALRDTNDSLRRENNALRSRLDELESVVAQR